MATILVTGSRGLIGSALCDELRARGHEVLGLDPAVAGLGCGDVTRPWTFEPLIRECDGVVHLGGVSRVVHGQRDPERCLAVNVAGTQNVIDAAVGSETCRWLLSASSREVYGQQEVLPVREDADLAPMNVYASSKVEVERMTIKVRELGLCTGIVRFSGAYGTISDHHDRVVPAFCRAAASGGVMTVEGRDHLLDFTHVSDVVLGISSMIAALDAGQDLPPIHLVSGVGTRLEDLARMAASASKRECLLVDGEQRSYDVSRFVGDPSRAEQILGWRASTSLEDGIAGLVEAFAAEQALAS